MAEKIADSSVFEALVRMMTTRLHPAPPQEVPSLSAPEVVVAVVSSYTQAAESIVAIDW